MDLLCQLPLRKAFRPFFGSLQFVVRIRAFINAMRENRKKAFASSDRSERKGPNRGGPSQNDEWQGMSNWGWGMMNNNMPAGKQGGQGWWPPHMQAYFQWGKGFDMTMMGGGGFGAGKGGFGGKGAMYGGGGPMYGGSGGPATYGPATGSSPNMGGYMGTTQANMGTPTTSSNIGSLPVPDHVAKVANAMNTGDLAGVGQLGDEAEHLYEQLMLGDPSAVFTVDDVFTEHFDALAELQKFAEEKKKASAGGESAGAGAAAVEGFEGSASNAASRRMNAIFGSGQGGPPPAQEDSPPPLNAAALGLANGTAPKKKTTSTTPHTASSDLIFASTVLGSEEDDFFRLTEQLLDIISFYESFEVDDLSGGALSRQDLLQRHYDLYNRLRKVCFDLLENHDEEEEDHVPPINKGPKQTQPEEAKPLFEKLLDGALWLNPKKQHRGIKYYSTEERKEQKTRLRKVALGYVGAELMENFAGLATPLLGEVAKRLCFFEVSGGGAFREEKRERALLLAVIGEQLKLQPSQVDMVNKLSLFPTEQVGRTFRGLFVYGRGAVCPRG